MHKLKFAGRAVATLGVVCLFCFTAAFAQKTPISVDELYLAKESSEGGPAEATETFLTTDSPIYCVVILNSPGPAVIKMQFVPLGASGKNTRAIVTAGYTLGKGEDRVYFTGKPFKLWSPGRYRVDITIDGTLARSAEFSIVERQGTIPAKRFARPETKPRDPHKKKPN